MILVRFILYYTRFLIVRGKETMDISNPVYYSVPTPVHRPTTQAQQGFLAPIPVSADQFSSAGFMTATLIIASAASIGGNMVDVKNGTMTQSQAVVNGVVKGAAASVVMAFTPKKNIVDIALTAAALAGTGYAIDRIMKKNKDEICKVVES